VTGTSATGRPVHPATSAIIPRSAMGRERCACRYVRPRWSEPLVGSDRHGVRWRSVRGRSTPGRCTRLEYSYESSQRRCSSATLTACSASSSALTASCWPAPTLTTTCGCGTQPTRPTPDAETTETRAALWVEVPRDAAAGCNTVPCDSPSSLPTPRRHANSTAAPGVHGRAEGRRHDRFNARRPDPRRDVCGSRRGSGRTVAAEGAADLCNVAMAAARRPRPRGAGQVGVLRAWTESAWSPKVGRRRFRPLRPRRRTRLATRHRLHPPHRRDVFAVADPATGRPGPDIGVEPVGTPSRPSAVIGSG